MESVVEARLREFATEMQGQLETSSNGEFHYVYPDNNFMSLSVDLRADASRQHEETLASLTSSVQEQTSTAMSNVLSLSRRSRHAY